MPQGGEFDGFLVPPSNVSQRLPVVKARIPAGEVKTIAFNMGVWVIGNDEVLYSLLLVSADETQDFGHL